jgi:hypothetical protein
LPFLKNKMEASASTPADHVTRKSDDEEGLEIDGMETAMEELFSAKTNKERAAAFRAAFQFLEESPHSEVLHES